jgi:hypothetical protein
MPGRPWWVLDLPAEIVDQLRELRVIVAKGLGWAPIIQDYSVEKGGDPGDCRRLQWVERFDRNRDKRKWRKPLRLRSAYLLRSVEGFLRERGVAQEGHFADVLSFLRSLPLCKQQMFHYDYNIYPEKLSVVPLVVVFPLDEFCTLDFREEKVFVRFGQVLVFPGNVVHAGSRYTCENTRVHIYLNTYEVEERGENTYPETT